MRISVTSDFICPWCYLGQARLFKALQSLPGVDADVNWKAFELNPDMPVQGMERRAYRSRKFGWERSLQMDAHLTALGREDGVAFHFERIERTPNTRLAHRLTRFARMHGQETPYVLKVFEAYFGFGADIGKPDVLLQLLTSLSLDADEARRFIESGDGLQAVLTDEAAAMQDAIHGVPHLTIGKVSVSGAQDWRILQEALLAAT